MVLLNKVGWRLRRWQVKPSKPKPDGQSEFWPDRGSNQEKLDEGLGRELELQENMILWGDSSGISPAL